MHYRTLILLPFLTVVASGLQAQGCSDAGACTAGPIGQLELWTGGAAEERDYRHGARLGFSYAIGEQGTIITQVLPELNIGLGERWSVQLKTSYMRAQGDLADNKG